MSISGGPPGHPYRDEQVKNLSDMVVPVASHDQLPHFRSRHCHCLGYCRRGRHGYLWFSSQFPLPIRPRSARSLCFCALRHAGNCRPILVRTNQRISGSRPLNRRGRVLAPNGLLPRLLRGPRGARQAKASQGHRCLIRRAPRAAVRPRLGSAIRTWTRRRCTHTRRTGGQTVRSTVIAGSAGRGTPRDPS